MSIPAVHTAKLSAPRLRNVVERPRVVRALDEASDHSLTWVRGRPGAGKSVVLGQYAAGLDRPVVWLRLEPADGDIAVFYDHLGAAATKTWPRRKLRLPALHPEHLIDIERYAARFADALLGRCRVQPLFVFDDYHRLREHTHVHTAVRALIEALGDGGRVLVGSRQPPPASFGKSIISGSVAFIEPEYLDFDAAEIRAAGVQHHPEELSQEAARHVLDTTQGWATGVILMLRADPARDFVDDPPRVLFDFFISEVFDEMDGPTKSMLLATAFLPTFDERLARKLLGEEATPSLTDLELRTMFTFRDGPKGRYRHHDLFREFLQNRVRATSSAAANDLALRTARAIENEDPASAAALMIACQAWERLAELVLSQAMIMVLAGRFQTLCDWVVQLPGELVTEEPWLGYWYGVANLVSDPIRAYTGLWRAMRGFADRQNEVGYALAFSSLINAVLAERNDASLFDAPLALLLSLRQRGWPDSNPFIEANIASGAAIALSFRDPAHPELVEWRARARATVTYLPTPDQRAVALVRIALSDMWSGDFVQASTTLDDLQGLVDDDKDSPFLAGSLYTTVQYLKLYAAPRECRTWLKRGLEAAARTGTAIWVGSLRLHDCAAVFSMGRYAEGAALLDGLSEILPNATRIEQCYFAELRAWQALANRDWRAAIRYAEKGSLIAVAYGAALPRWNTTYATAMAHIGLGDAERASMLLDLLDAEGSCTRFLPFQVHLARAQLALVASDAAGALHHTSAGLAISEEIGCLNYSHWCNENLAPVLHFALQEGVHPEQAQSLLDHHEMGPAVPARQGSAAQHWAFSNDGRTFVPPGRPRVHLGRRQASRRILVTLVQTRIEHPGRSLSTEALFEYGWPSQQIRHTSAQARLWTAIRDLRSLGLASLLETSGEGYRLDPAVEIRWIDPTS